MLESADYLDKLTIRIKNKFTTKPKDSQIQLTYPIIWLLESADS